MTTKNDEYWMRRALELANHAASCREVPVGAVVVLGDQVIGEGYNQPISTSDPSAHAEMEALRHAAHTVNNYRLVDTTMYTTLEPCLMCAGAMVHARIKRLVYGAVDPKGGAIVSKTYALDQPFLNHKIEHTGGLLADQCGDVLKKFFKERR